MDKEKNKNQKYLLVEKNNKKITEIENDLYTPIKTITNNNKIDIKYTSNNSKKIPKTTKSAEKRKKKIKINKIELTDNKQEINRKINYNLFSEEKLRKNKKNKKKINSIDSSLKLTKDLIKKQQEEIDFNRKFDYLKNRIEALKIKEEKIRMEKNYIQKKEIKLGKNIILALAANKCDDYINQKVNIDEGKELAKKLNAIFALTSAKQGNGIEYLFKLIAEKFVDPNKNIAESYMNKNEILEYRNKIKIEEIRKIWLDKFEENLKKEKEKKQNNENNKKDK